MHACECVHAYMRVCIYNIYYISMHVQVNGFPSLAECVCMCVCICVFVRLCMHACVRVRACSNVQLSFPCRMQFGQVHMEELEYQPVNVEVRGGSRQRFATAGRPGHSRNPSLVWALTKTFGASFMAAAIFKLGQDLLGFASPQILKCVNRKCVFV